MVRCLTKGLRNKLGETNKNRRMVRDDVGYLKPIA